MVLPSVIVDARWVMSFAAGIGDLNRQHMDTASGCTLIAHPMHYWAVTWPIMRRIVSLSRVSLLHSFDCLWQEPTHHSLNRNQ